MSAVTTTGTHADLAAWAALVPRWKPPVDVPSPTDPLQAVERLVRAGLADQHAVYERGVTWHLGIGAVADLTLDARELRLTAGGSCWTTAVSQRPMDDVAVATGALSDGGWRGYGWVTFELAHLLHGDPAAAGTEPLLHLVIPQLDVELTPGHARIRSTAPEWVARVKDLLNAETDAPPTACVPVLVPDPRTYHRAVTQTVADIAAGRLEKAVLSRAVPLPEPTELDLVATYVAGRRANTPARSFLLDLGGWRAVGFSPETVVEVDGAGHVQTQPLAGTRALGSDAAQNRRLRDELLRDPKEIHEHAISVRLAMEEVATICGPDSVAVTEFMAVRERGTVQHLASRVHGRLRGGETAWSALAALFPAVTVTGAPKTAALRAVRAREDGPRGLYAGAVLMTGDDGSLDAALVLRTVFQHGGSSWLRVGAGVMGQSTPEREWEETCEKLASIAPFLRARASDPVPRDRSATS